jgi:uncharacterized membrane protein
MPDKIATAPTSVKENIRAVAAMETSLEEHRTLVDRVADVIGGFSGSMTFVLLHVFWFVTWFLINTGMISGVKRFDPYPFILLAMVVSVEGVLLSTFVLMKQNRMQKRIDIRDQLDLQINLLTEKEVTKTLQLLRTIADEVGVQPTPEDDEELKEMASTTSVDMLAQRLKAICHRRIEADVNQRRPETLMHAVRNAGSGMRQGATHGRSPDLPPPPPEAAWRPEAHALTGPGELGQDPLEQQRDDKAGIAEQYGVSIATIDRIVRPQLLKASGPRPDHGLSSQQASRG